MASDTPRTPSIRVPMRSSMVFMVAASRSNSSPRPESATREERSPPAMAAVVAKAGRIRACSRPAHQPGAEEGQRTRAMPEVQSTPSVRSWRSRSRSVRRGRPAGAARAAPPCSSRASVSAPSCTHAGAEPVLGGVPGDRPAVEVAGEAPVGVGGHQQVDAVVLDIDREPFLDRLDEARASRLRASAPTRASASARMAACRSGGRARRPSPATAPRPARPRRRRTSPRTARRSGSRRCAAAGAGGARRPASHAGRRHG